MKIIISFGTNDPNEWQYVDHVILINVYFNTKPFTMEFFFICFLLPVELNFNAFFR